VASSTEDRLLYLLKSRGPQSAGDAGEVLGMTPPGAQQRFAKLAAAGLVEAEDRKQGRGRPKRYWRLTAQGHARFPDRHSDLMLEVLRSTREVFGAQGLESLIRHREAATLGAYRAELAGCATLEQRVARLAGIRTREGYMAEWEKLAPNRFLLVENHCPVCAAAAACQGLCRSELEIFRAVLAPASVERTDHVLAGARRCAYLVTRRRSR
jgi:predicted ArsR family transcriptional regulator